MSQQKDTKNIIKKVSAEGNLNNKIKFIFSYFFCKEKWYWQLNQLNAQKVQSMKNRLSSYFILIHLPFFDQIRWIIETMLSKV